MPERPLDHVNLRLVDSTEKAGEFMRWLSERRRVLGVDTESSGTRHDSKLRLVQYGDLHTGWAIPWERWGGLAVEAFRKYTDPIVLHNSSFDMRMFTQSTRPSELGRWPWERTHDTMALAHILDPQRPKALKGLAGTLVDYRAAAAQSMLDDAMRANKWSWGTVPVDFPYYWIYGAMDPVLTCHLYEQFIDEVEAKYKYVYELELGTIRVCSNMMLKGARVDIDYCVRKRAELKAWVQTARDWCREVFGIQNATSNAQVIKAFERIGVKLLDKATGSGAQSLDKEVLQAALPHPLAQTILNIRKAEKNTGPYFDNFIEDADVDSRLHPTIWTMGTRTARMSVTEPALQTLPRKDPLVRGAFVPSDGHALITSDYDQIEARLAAHFSGDRAMIDAFNSPEDFFCVLASQIYGRPIDKVKDKEDRQLVKNTTYGKLYGAGIAKMALTAGVPYEVMEPVVNAFDARSPGIVRFQREVDLLSMQREAQDGQAWIQTPYGRRLFPDPGKNYTLVNYLIQSHGAEILKRSLLELDAAGLGEYMILPVHDEVVLDVPLDVADDVLEMVPRIMAKENEYAVPITASADKLLTDWGEKYR